jgi:hypothetical protein
MSSYATTDQPEHVPADPVPDRLLCVQSSLGLWAGEGWAKKWCDAVSYPDGKACLESAEQVAKKTGVRCVMAYVELRPAATSAA